MYLALMIACCTMIASLIGFGIGYWYGRNNLRWQFKKLAKDAQKLLPTVLGQLDAAEQACRRLNALPKLNLTNVQTNQLEDKQTGLIDSLGQLLSRLKPDLDSAKAAAREKENIRSSGNGNLSITHLIFQMPRLSDTI
ncbi:MAG: hypothetical protein R3C11_26165 [Planctomycetaceae bacterium]